MIRNAGFGVHYKRYHGVPDDECANYDFFRKPYIDHKDPSLQSGMPLPARRTPTIDEIAGHVAAVCDVEKDDLYRKRSTSAIARSLFMELCCEYLNAGMSMTEIGRELGKVSVAALSHNKRRLHTRMEKNRTIRKLYETVRKGLEQS